MKIQINDEHCEGCVWLKDGQLCPFPYPSCYKNLGLKKKGEDKDGQERD